MRMNNDLKFPQENDVLPLPSNADLRNVLAKRRSSKILDFDPEIGPNDEELVQILSLGIRVPDHGKIAPWRLISLRGDKRAELGKKAAQIVKAQNPNADEQHLAMEKARFLRAHSVIFLVSSPIIHPKVPIWEQELSCGALCYNILLAANSFGYSATWLSEWVAYDTEFAKILGLKIGEKLAGVIYIGKAKTAPIERERKPLSQVLSAWE